MKTGTLTLIATVTTLALLLVATAAFAAPHRPGAREGAGPGMGQGRGPGAGAGPGGGFGQARIEVTPDSTKLWRELGALQLKQHRALWELWTLQAGETPDEAAVTAKQQELQGLQEQMREKHQALGEFRRGTGAGQGAGRGEDARRGPADGRGLKRGPKDGTGRGDKTQCDGDCPDCRH